MKRCFDDSRSYGVESNVLFRVFRSQASQSCFQATFSDHRNGSGYITGHRGYPAGQKVSDGQMAQINLTMESFHGEWNHTSHPPTTPKVLTLISFRTLKPHRRSSCRRCRSPATVEGAIRRIRNALCC